MEERESIPPVGGEAHRVALDNEVLAAMAAGGASVPVPLRLMAMRPGTVAAFAGYRDQVLEGGPLGKRERALVQLTAAAAMRLTSCLHKLTEAAKKAGVREAEIVQAMLIAGLQSGTSLLHTAYGGFEATCTCGQERGGGAHAQE